MFLFHSPGRLWREIRYLFYFLRKTTPFSISLTQGPDMADTTHCYSTATPQFCLFCCWQSPPLTIENAKWQSQLLVFPASMAATAWACGWFLVVETRESAGMAFRKEFPFSFETEQNKNRYTLEALVCWMELRPLVLQRRVMTALPTWGQVAPVLPLWERKRVHGVVLMKSLGWTSPGAM